MVKPAALFLHLLGTNELLEWMGRQAKKNEAYLSMPKHEKNLQ